MPNPWLAWRVAAGAQRSICGCETQSVHTPTAALRKRLRSTDIITISVLKAQSLPSEHYCRQSNYG